MRKKKLKYPRAFRIARGLYITLFVAGLCSAGVLLVFSPRSLGGGPYVAIRGGGSRMLCPVPDGTPLRCCGISVQGTSSGKPESSSSLLAVRSGDEIVAVAPLTTPGPFDVFMSLHLFPGGGEKYGPLDLELLHGAGDFSISSCALIPVEARPAPTVKELLSSPKRQWYPLEIAELVGGPYDSRIAAARALAESRDRRAARALIDAYTKKWTLAVCEAIWALGDVATPELVRLYRESMSAGLTEQATNVLWATRGKLAGDFFRDLVKGDDRRTAVYAAGCLSRMGDDSGVPVAVSALDSPDATVRVEACWAIGKSRNEEARLRAFPVAIQLLESEDSYVRHQAMHALSNLRFREALPLYLEWLKDEQTTVRCHAVSGIGRLEDPSLLPYILNALREEKEPRASLDFLNFVPPQEASREMVDILRTEESEAVRLKIIRNLRWGDPDIIPVLEEYCSREGLGQGERAAVRKTIEGLRKGPEESQ